MKIGEKGFNRLSDIFLFVIIYTFGNRWMFIFRNFSLLLINYRDIQKLPSIKNKASFTKKEERSLLYLRGFIRRLSVFITWCGTTYFTTSRRYFIEEGYSWEFI